MCFLAFLFRVLSLWLRVLVCGYCVVLCYFGLCGFLISCGFVSGVWPALDFVAGFLVLWFGVFGSWLMMVFMDILVVVRLAAVRVWWAVLGVGFDCAWAGWFVLVVGVWTGLLVVLALAALVGFGVVFVLFRCWSGFLWF